MVNRGLEVWTGGQEKILKLSPSNITLFFCKNNEAQSGQNKNWLETEMTKFLLDNRVDEKDDTTGLETTKSFIKLN